MPNLDPFADRTIDTVTHQYSGKQLLARVLDHWNQSTALPVFIVAPRNEAEWRINAMRVALSKERKKQRINSHYGLAVSDVFPWRHKTGVKVEAVVIRFSQNKFQQLSLVWDKRIIGRMP